MITRFLGLLVAVPAFAATITLTALPSNLDYGTYNGWVSAIVDGEANQPLICDDFSHTTYVPSGKLVFNESSLVAQIPLEFARFTDGNFSSTLVRYEEAAILLDGLNKNPGLTSAYQYALWHLFTPSVSLPNATAKTLLDDAYAQVLASGATNANLYPRLSIYTPTQPYASNQEFLRLQPLSEQMGNDPSSVPEPTAGSMFGIGLALIGISFGSAKMLRRRAERLMRDSNLRASER